MEAEPVKSKKPKDTPFRQQRLKACQPILTPTVVVIVFLTVGVIMFPLGFIMWHYNGQVVEVEIRYDNTCGNPLFPPPTKQTCPFAFNIPRDIPGDVFFYYKLTNYYQNHRRYVSSRNDNQLAGTPPQSFSALSACTPIMSVNDSSLPQDFYMPCGLVANSFFLDQYDGPVPAGATDPLPWSRTGIAWPSDVAAKFKQISPTYLASNPKAIGLPPPNRSFLVQQPGVEQFNVTNEDFIVWMRVAGLPTFRKLYAKLPADVNGIGLPQGDYTMDINIQISTNSFGNGTKSIVFTNLSFLGGYNTFLGYAYIAVGSACLLLAAVFFLINIIKPRKLGDPSLLSWNKN